MGWRTAHGRVPNDNFSTGDMTANFSLQTDVEGLRAWAKENRSVRLHWMPCFSRVSHARMPSHVDASLMYSRSGETSRAAYRSTRSNACRVLPCFVRLAWVQTHLHR